MTSTRVRRTAAGAFALCVVVALSGCESSGGAEEPKAGSSEGASETTAPSASPEASESPAVEPTTGLRLESGGLALRAPEGWKKFIPVVHFKVQEVAKEPGTVDTTVDVRSLTSLNENQTVEDLAQGEIEHQSGPKGTSLKRAGTVTLDGVEFYRNVGRYGRNVWIYGYGALIGDRTAGFTIGFDKWAHPDKQDREAIVAAILASVEVDPNAS